LSVPEIDSSSRAYRPEIDGIRAIAIISVILYHAGVPWFHGGFTGVDIFFVISGYLIGGHILSDLHTGNFSFLQFYRRRAKRILPAFYLVLAFTIIAALVLLSPHEAQQFGESGFAATLSISNIYFSRSLNNYFAASTEFYPLLMTWSLGVEEQFYAVIPFLMVLLVRIRRRLLLPAVLAACSLSFLLACFELGRSRQITFYLLPTRAWELGVGVALALAELNRKRALLSGLISQMASLLGLALLFAPMALLTTASPFPGAAALPSVLGAALVIAARSCWINQNLLSFPSLVFIGRISYSWYLWQWPILSFLRILSAGELPPAIVALAIAASLGAAIISYYFIEQPFRNSTRKAAPLLVRYALVSLVALAACAVIDRCHGLPQRYPPVAQAENAIPGLWSDAPCLTDYDTPNLSPLCYNPSDHHPSVALWGDSHSSALAPGLRVVASKEGYSFVELGKPACWPLSGAIPFNALKPRFAAQCLRFNQRVLNILATDRNIKIVILAGYWDLLVNQTSDGEWVTEGLAESHRVYARIEARKLFMDSLAATIRSLQASGKYVIVMDDAPIFDFNPLLRTTTMRIPARRAIASWLRILHASDSGFSPQSSSSSAALVSSLLQETIARCPAATLVDLKSGLCDNNGQCIYRKNDQVFYRDNNHLTPDGARYALRDFRLPLPLQ
jgi:peptidoglycan/LPS O-acetylase OafA/YrhL